MTTPDQKTPETDGETPKFSVDEVLSRAGAGTYDLTDGDDTPSSDFGNDFDPNKPAETPPSEGTPAESETPDAGPANTPPQSEETPPEEPPVPAEKAKKRSTVIPRERFDELNDKYKATQAELERLRAEKEAAPKAEDPAPVAFDFDAKEAEYMEAVLDGDKDKALAIRKEIRAAEAKVLAPKPADPVPTASELKAQIAYDDLVVEMNERYPVFDPTSEAFDKDLTEEAVALTRVYRQQGLSADKALRKAVDKVVKANDISAAVEGEPAEETPEETPGAKPKNAPQDPPKLDPNKVKEKMDLAAKQPPRPAGGNVPVRESEVDLDSMSLEEYAALPEATRARLRGDLL